jgi:hypothetical protein
MIPRDSRLTRHPSCLTNGVHLIKVRQNGRIVSIAAIIATGVNQDGRREILGLGQSEAATFWIEFLRGLVRRGLKGVKLVISDAHEGLKAAITQVLLAALPGAFHEITARLRAEKPAECRVGRCSAGAPDGPDRAVEQGSQTPHQCCWHLPE